MIKIKNGLDLPLSGIPRQQIADTKFPRRVAIVGEDFVDMSPALLVEIGDEVKKGQKLFENKKNPGVFFTSPASGTVRAIHRGERRVFQSLEIEVSAGSQVRLASFQTKNPEAHSRDSVKELLLESGLWNALRTRPYSKTPKPDAAPMAIFVNAMDTQPHAPNPEVAIEGKEDAFRFGIKILKHLSEGSVYVVTAPGSKCGFDKESGIVHKEFSGPHPAGNVGTHIHFLHPVSAKRHVWHVGAQDVVAIGHLFRTGDIDTTRVISLGGPLALNPRLVRTNLGACLSEISSGEVDSAKEVRIVSGSVLSGRGAKGVFDFLGRFHHQVSFLEEGKQRDFLGWQSPGLNKFSLKPVFLSHFFPRKRFSLNTNLHGSHRAIVPIGSYEKVMPFDLLPTLLYRQLLAGNWENSLELGALELDEEDLALSTFVDPCKNDFGLALRDVLRMIEKEG